VLDNLAFGLRMRGVGKAERYVAARRAADVLGITDLLDRQPKQLSGGQRQRVAMGRAIVREPQAFLMDEPLSNLDAKLRVQMRAEIARIQRTLGVTTLYVTHDQVEAMTMADRVAVMRKGVLQQVAPPAEVYDRPANLFVAGFIGSPPMNLFAAHIVAGDAGHVVEFGSSRLALADRPGLAELVGREVVLGIRPEDLEDTAFDPGAPPDRRLVATVDLVEQLGSDVLVRTVIDAVPATGEQVIDAAEGTQVGVAAGAPLVARCNPRSRPVRGGTIELSVDTERIHLFDPATGLAIR
jgi:multiple sugar transport system ATP-binding protein